ncbi:penicillin-binding protein 1C [Methylococcus capsulatus]|uniref:penicillin-binding protein 1C n=1 Tax=Methylococcus capsulatus TaxID=414 RepID=UPI002FD8E2C8
MSGRSSSIKPWGAGIALLLFAAGGAVFWNLPRSAIPEFRSVRAEWIPSDAYLLDRNGEVIHEQRVDFSARRSPWMPLRTFSPALVKAILAAEDRRFHDHGGVDWRAMAVAAWETLGGRKRGASTITMQLTALLDQRLARHGGGRSVRQKLGQIGAARKLEHRWSKDEILEAYLNRVRFRGELEGVPATALGLFGKEASGLDEAESVLLAAILPSPNVGAARIARRACAIAKAAAFPLDCGDLERRAEMALSHVERPPPPIALAPHLARQSLKKRGEKVRTTLSTPIQRRAIQALEQQLRGLKGRNVRDGAALVVDNHGGEVLAYVGSAGPDSRARQVDGVRARRQAGSTLKPFLYALALEKRYLTAASILDDSPLDLETRTGLYVPQNYDRDFKGRVSVRTALAASLNIPAIRTLILVGLEPFHERLWNLGYRGLTQDGEYYGYSLALGSGEVSLWEQVNAFRTLANGGLTSPLHWLADDAPGEPRPLIDPRAAYIVGSILSDRSSRALSFGLDNPLTTRYWSAVKTGTSKNMRDNWCIGYSEHYTVGVWVGNFEGDAMHEVSGVTGAAPAWLEIMNGLHADLPSRPPAPPEGVIGRRIRYADALEPEREEWFVAGTELAEVTAPEAPTPRIETPADGMIIALDPDIPARNQKLILRARPARAGISFFLDGRPVGPAEAPVKWSPEPGGHVLKLMDDRGRTLDLVRFEVRGMR